MAERYSRVFSLAENLYTEGAPLLLAAGALLKDTQSGKLIAQLKLKNIGAKAIRAATVRLVPLDSADRPLGEALSYDYLDLNAERDAEFGAKNPISLPQSSARAFTAAVTEVFFADKSTWSAPEGAVWEPLAAPETPERALKDAELGKQYRLRFGADTVRMPAEEKDLWFCACGAVNGQAEETCHRCGKARGELLALDPEELKAARDRRLAQERAAREAAEKKAAAERLVAERRAEAQAKAKKTKKLLAVTLSIVLLLVAGFLLTTKVLIPNSRYQKALELAEAGQYEEAIAAFEALGDYKDAPERSFALWGRLARWETVSAALSHTVGLRSDGTVVAMGSNKHGQCDVSGWTDVVAVSAGGFHTVGLRSDGTVVAVGFNELGECNVSGWTDIVAVSAGSWHTVGLRSDGTVVAVGWNEYGQCEVSDWENVVAVSAGWCHTVALRSDGTVVATGSNKFGQCEISGWTDVVTVSAGLTHTVGLRADGTVVATKFTGQYYYGQCEVSGWTDIVAISAGRIHTVGLRADGTVVATGSSTVGQCDVIGWENVVAISAGNDYTLGLVADGTVVATGYNCYGHPTVIGWRGIKLPN